MDDDELIGAMREIAPPSGRVSVKELASFLVLTEEDTAEFLSGAIERGAVREVETTWDFGSTTEAVRSRTYKPA